MTAGSPVLVTGATGFLGGALVARLRSRGESVVATTRSSPPLDSPGLAWRRCDLADRLAVSALVEASSPRTIFHLASAVTGGRGVDLVAPTFLASLASTVHLLEAAAKTKPERFVLAGSMEEPEPGEIASSPYAAAKAGATIYARLFQALYGTPVAIARLFMVYGPGQRDRSKLVPHAITRLLRDERVQLSSGRRPVDWIHVDDAVDGLVAVGDRPQAIGATVDLGSGELVTVADVARRIASALGRPELLDFGALPDRPLEPTRRADIEATAARIGWRPRIDLDSGLESTIAWYRAAAEP